MSDAWKERLYVVGVLAAVSALAVAAYYGYLYLSRRPPGDVADLVDARREAIEAFAAAALARCPELEAPGVGDTSPPPTSPAAGTAIEGWADLLDARAGCMRYTPEGPHDALGEHFAPLVRGFRDPEESAQYEALLSGRDAAPVYEGTSRVDGLPWQTEGDVDDATIVGWRDEVVRIEVRRRWADGAGYAYAVVFLRRAP